MTQLTPEQLAGIEKIHAWHAGAFGADPFRLFGPAGTGKTTMAREIPAALGLDPSRVAYGAYTGKAVHVLRGKGCEPASTIHSAVYFPTQDAEAVAELAAARSELAELEDTARELTALKHDEARAALVIGLGWASVMEFSGALDEGRETVKELEAQTRRLSWEWNQFGPWSALDLIILDEVSMVGAKLAADIEAYGVPILVLGDPAQLPPVEGGGYYTDAQPDHLLTEIHRQALESQPLRLATSIRTSTGTSLGLADSDRESPSLAAAMRHDQVLCWSNRRRWNLIDAMRVREGRTPGVPTAGDRVMCLTNNKEIAVFNGAQFTVVDTVADSALGPTLRLQDESGHTRDIACFSDGFRGREAQDNAKKSGAGIRGQRMLATFAQAITVHKAQGSEWPSVYVVDETPGMISMGTKRVGQAEAYTDARRWLYTAVSRASESVTVARAGR
jgi:exodeoxyribonuclease V